MAIRANPNRMELLKLKRRISVAKRGHKLLKDKLDELLRRFVVLVRDADAFRRKVEYELMEAFQLLALARAETGTRALEAALVKPSQPLEISVGEQRVLSVKVPSFALPDLKLEVTYSLATTPAILDRAVMDLEMLFTNLISLAELEKKIQLLSLEIEKTRRRVNALEYILLPQLEEAIRFITMSLDEMERANRTRLMKIKGMLEAR